MLYAKKNRQQGDYLAIGAGYCIREVSRRETILQGLQTTATLRGELYVELAALMDGTLRQADISARLSEGFDEASVDRAISEMLRLGYARYVSAPVFEIEAALRFMDIVTTTAKPVRDAPPICYTADGVLKPGPGIDRRRQGRRQGGALPGRKRD